MIDPKKRLQTPSSLGPCMKAIVCPRYGPPEVLQFKEVEKPIPKNNEVLVRVHAATVTTGDCEFRGLKLPLAWQLMVRIGFGFRRPRKKILGQEQIGRASCRERVERAEVEGTGEKKGGRE